MVPWQGTLQHMELGTRRERLVTPANSSRRGGACIADAMHPYCSSGVHRGLRTTGVLAGTKGWCGLRGHN